MCIIFIDYNPASCIRSTKPYQLVIACNRDEFYDRPTQPARFWTDSIDTQNIIAGKDSLNGGSWLGFTKHGRFALLTNYRKKFNSPLFQGKTRGMIVLDYLTGAQSPTDYCTNVLSDPSEYDGFNLIVGSIKDTSQEMVYCSNRCEKGVCPLVGGVYGLSNASLDTPWAKVEEGKKKFEEIIDKRLEKDKLIEELLKLLNDDTCYYPDPQIHDTGFPEHWLKGTTSIFSQVSGERYGTRSNTVILVDKDGIVTFVERSMKEPIIEGSYSWITTKDKFKIINY